MKNKVPQPVSLLILTAITVVMWVTFAVYRSFVEPPEVNIPANVLKPLDPKIDNNAIEVMKSRIQLTQ